MTEKAHSFDWHEENRKGSGGSFLAWAVLTMMPTAKRDDPFFDELSEATDRFTRCELGVTLNGIPVDAEKFMERLDEAVDHAVEHEAQKIIKEMPRLDALYGALHDFEREVKERVIQLAAEAGIELGREDW